MKNPTIRFIKISRFVLSISKYFMQNRLISAAIRNIVPITIRSFLFCNGYFNEFISDPKFHTPSLYMINNYFLFLFKQLFKIIR